MRRLYHGVRPPAIPSSVSGIRGVITTAPKSQQMLFVLEQIAAAMKTCDE
jgi:hypothetical protein